MKTLLLLVIGLGLLYGDPTDEIKYFQNKAKTEAFVVPAKKVKVATWKSKVKVKEAKKKKNTFPELCIDDKKEVDIPRGVEFSENFSGNLVVNELLKLVGELQFSEKFLGNRKNSDKVQLDDLLDNTIKYVVGFNWQSPDVPISIEGSWENKVKNSVQVRDYRPVKFENKGAEFDKFTLKVKMAY